METGNHQILPRSFYDLFIGLLVDLPELDTPRVCGEQLEVLALSWKPSDAVDGFFDLDRPQGIELFGVGLELGEVLHLLVFVLGIGVVVEDDDSASMVAQC